MFACGRRAGVTIPLCALIALFLVCAPAEARDAFDAVKCGTDISKSLIGKSMPEGTVMTIEARHKAIGLKDLGADEISERLQMIEWRMCGSDYNILVDSNDKMRDVLRFPAHDRTRPEFGGTCQINGKDSPDWILALLDNRKSFDADTSHHYSPGDGKYLPALAAWRIDEKRGKFVSLTIDGVLCLRSGINSVDGGP